MELVHCGLIKFSCYSSNSSIPQNERFLRPPPTYLHFYEEDESLVSNAHSHVRQGTASLSLEILYSQQGIKPPSNRQRFFTRTTNYRRSSIQLFLSNTSPTMQFKLAFVTTVLATLVVATPAPRDGFTCPNPAAPNLVCCTAAITLGAVDAVGANCVSSTDNGSW